MTNGQNERLDRIERIVEVVANNQIDMQSEIRVLLSAQIAFAEDMRRMAEKHNQLAEETDRRFRETTDKLNALIHIVDDLIRRRPPA